MQELDQWTDDTVIDPLHEAVTNGDSEACRATCDGIKKAIRQKVLDSYRNGRQGSRAGGRGGRHGS